MEEADILGELREQHTNPKKKRAKREKKEIKKTGILTKVKLSFVILIIALTGVAYATEKYVDWRAEHQWQFPAKWIGMVKTIDRSITTPIVEAKTPVTEEEILSGYRLAPVIKSIYMLESTSGKNDGCKDEGKVNGFGYRQNSRENKCYDSLEEVADKVNEWFEERMSGNGNNLIEAVCYYNTGIEYQSSCGDYSENFWSVITNYF